MNADRGRRTTEPVALIALGSNLGDSVATVRKALRSLQALSNAPIRHSSLWQTTPVDCPPGSPLFVNAAAALVPQAGETPESLLRKLQSLEKDFGRAPRQVLNEARPLDLDLIAFGNESRRTAELTLPHPRAHRRRFVLEPLAEIAPDFVLPGQEVTILELVAALETPERVVRLRTDS